jgi:hypothetical protein
MLRNMNAALAMVVVAREPEAPWAASPFASHAPPDVELPPLTREELQERYEAGEVDADDCERVLVFASRMRAVIDVGIAPGLHALCQGDRLAQLGYWLDDYAREVLDVAETTTRNLVQLGAELPRRPLLDAARCNPGASASARRRPSCPSRGATRSPGGSSARRRSPSGNSSRRSVGRGRASRSRTRTGCGSARSCGRRTARSSSSASRSRPTSCRPFALLHRARRKAEPLFHVVAERGKSEAAVEPASQSGSRSGSGSRRRSARRSGRRSRTRSFGCSPC